VIKAVFFDYAHTLVKIREEDEARFMNRAIRSMQISLAKRSYETDFNEFKRVDLDVFGEADKSAAQTLRELNIEEVYSKILGRIGIEAMPRSQLVKDLIDSFFGSVIEHLVLCPYVESTLRHLKEAGFKIGVITNYPQPRYLKLALKRLKIEEYFDILVTSADVGFRKPRAEIFEKALEGLHVKPWEAVMVGRSLSRDIKGAMAVGMKGILLSSKKQVSPLPNATVRDLTHIVDIILSMKNRVPPQEVARGMGQDG